MRVFEALKSAFTRVFDAYGPRIGIQSGMRRGSNPGFRLSLRSAGMTAERQARVTAATAS